MTRIALHACCGPCLIEPYDALEGQAGDVVVVYANPNIHGLDEYERRRDTLLDYASTHGITVYELPYDPARWMADVGRFGNDAERRCRACYRLRLRMVAEWAAENDCTALATTLSVSPYQDPDAIREEGESAAADVGLTWAGRDFRERYRTATQRSRELGMYRQRYCGCVLSQVEAARQRSSKGGSSANR